MKNIDIGNVNAERFAKVYSDVLYNNEYLIKCSESFQKIINKNLDASLSILSERMKILSVSQTFNFKQMNLVSEKMEQINNYMLEKMKLNNAYFASLEKLYQTPSYDFSKFAQGLLSSNVFDSIAKKMGEVEQFLEEDNAESYTNEEIELVQNSIEDVQKSDFEAIGEVFTEKIDSFKENHKVKCLFFYLLWTLVFQVIILPSLQSGYEYGLTKVKTLIKDGENKQEILQIPENTTVTIIADEAYYYQVAYCNAETGKIVTGYIAKRNITKQIVEE